MYLEVQADSIIKIRINLYIANTKGLYRRHSMSSLLAKLYSDQALKTSLRLKHESSTGED